MNAFRFEPFQIHGFSGDPVSVLHRDLGVAPIQPLAIAFAENGVEGIQDIVKVISFVDEGSNEQNKIREKSKGRVHEKQRTRRGRRR